MKAITCFFLVLLIFSFGCLEKEKEDIFFKLGLKIEEKDTGVFDDAVSESDLKIEEKPVITEEFEYLDYTDYAIFEMEKNIHFLVNEERKKLSLSSLEFDERLALIARKHSKDMAENGFFSHFDLQGKDFGYRYNQSNYKCKIKVGSLIHLGAENLFKYNITKSVYSTGEVAEYNSQQELEIAAVDGWMGSPGHKENIEKEFWLKEGIGVYINEKGEVLVTQNFC